MKLEEIPTHYDRVANRYDWMTAWIFGYLLGIERYRQTAANLLGNISGATVLDIGCGTGRNFPLLVSRVGNQGRVIGLDYSRGMLAQAQQRIERQGWDNVSLLHADTVTLTDVPPVVDAVISVWCFGIVYDLEAGLRRALDVLRPGGRIAILDFGRTRPDRGLWRKLQPVYAWLLQKSGIDTREDLDDARLQAKWALGRRLLETRLSDYHEQTYLGELGLLLSGRKPASAHRSPKTDARTITDGFATTPCVSKHSAMRYFPT